MYVAHTYTYTQWCWVKTSAKIITANWLTTLRVFVWICALFECAWMWRRRRSCLTFKNVDFKHLAVPDRRRSRHPFNAHSTISEYVVSWTRILSYSYVHGVTLPWCKQFQKPCADEDIFFQRVCRLYIL